MNPQHLSIEYVPYGTSDLQTYRLTLRSQETIYSGLINEHEFSSTYLELKDLDKVFRDENLGVSGLTSMVKYTENFKENIVVIEFELTFQRAAKTKRATEHYRLQVHKIERDLQLERITKLEALNERLQRENERMAKQIRTMKEFGFQPYFNKEICLISTCQKIEMPKTDKGGSYNIGEITIHGGVTNSKYRVYQSKHYLDYDATKHATFYNFLIMHPRLRQYATWVRQEHIPNQTGNPDIVPPTRLVFHDPSDTVEFLEGNFMSFATSINRFDIGYMSKLFQDNPYITIERNIINKRQNEFFCTLFDVVNEYNFKGKLLLPGGVCVPHPTNPDHVNEFFTERYCKNIPTPADKMFFDPNIGFYKCDLYDF